MECELVKECYNCTVGFGSNVLRGLMALKVHVHIWAIDGRACRQYSRINMS